MYYLQLYFDSSCHKTAPATRQYMPHDSTCHTTMAFFANAGVICIPWDMVAPARSATCTIPVTDHCSSSSLITEPIKLEALETSSMLVVEGSWIAAREIITLQPFGSKPSSGSTKLLRKSCQLKFGVTYCNFNRYIYYRHHGLMNNTWLTRFCDSTKKKSLRWRHCQSDIGGPSVLCLAILQKFICLSLYLT